MSALRRLFQSARERNSLTWREIYWQGGLYASQSGKLTVVKAKRFFCTFMAFLGSARVRVPLSNKIGVRVGSVQHIYGSLRVRVRIFGPVKTSNIYTYIYLYTLNKIINATLLFLTPPPPPPPNTVKLHILEWPFIVASLRHTLCIIMLSNQHLDMPHLWGGWIIAAKEKCSLTQI